MHRLPARTGMLAVAGASLALALGGGAAAGSAANRHGATGSGGHRLCKHRSPSPARRAHVVWTSAFPRSQALAFASVAASSQRRGAHSGAAGCHAGRRRSPAKHGVSPTAPGTSGPVDSNGPGPAGPGRSPETTAPGGSAPPSEPGAGEGPAPPSLPHVQVTAFEYGLILSRTSVPAGKVAFNFVNSGQDEHNFNALSGEGSLVGQLPNTESKAVRNLTIEMRHGKYTLFCSLPEHESKGMKATLTVE